MERRWLEKSILKEQSKNIVGQLFFEAKIPFEFLSGLKKKMCKPVLQKELSVCKCDFTVISLPSDCVRSKFVLLIIT